MNMLERERLESRKISKTQAVTTLGNVPIHCEVKFEVWDSPNSAGVVIDAVRCAKLAIDREMSGPLIAPSSYFMKSPPRQFTDSEARQRLEKFIDGEQTEEKVGTAPHVASRTIPAIYDRALLDGSN
jgi:myo-inositol-1-phosphate synthase